jgi:hypothetical protein
MGLARGAGSSGTRSSTSPSSSDSRLERVCQIIGRVIIAGSVMEMINQIDWMKIVHVWNCEKKIITC